MRGDTILHKDCKLIVYIDQPLYSPIGNGKLQVYYYPRYVLRESGNY